MTPAAFVADASPLQYRLRLHSGGPVMHVFWSRGEWLHCWWWNVDGQIAEAIIPRTLMRVVQWRWRN